MDQSTSSLRIFLLLMLLHICSSEATSNTDGNHLERIKSSNARFDSLLEYKSQVSTPEKVKPTRGLLSLKGVPRKLIRRRLEVWTNRRRGGHGYPDWNFNTDQKKGKKWNGGDDVICNEGCYCSEWYGLNGYTQNGESDDVRCKIFAYHNWSSQRRRRRVRPYHKCMYTKFECEKCKPGYILTGTKRDLSQHGLYPSGKKPEASTDSLKHCNDCPTGHTCDGSDTFTPCASGTYQSGTTPNQVCSACGTGRYQNIIGKSSCKACGVGKYHAQTRKSSEGACKTCTGGYYQDEEGSDSCKIVTAGNMGFFSSQILCHKGYYCKGGTSVHQCGHNTDNVAVTNPDSYYCGGGSSSPIKANIG